MYSFEERTIFRDVSLGSGNLDLLIEMLEVDRNSSSLGRPSSSAPDQSPVVGWAAVPLNQGNIESGHIR